VKDTAVTFTALGFLAGLILGLASCSPDSCAVQPAGVEVAR
jgi:hypothetical protein